MPLIIEHSLEIAAPAETVWSVITDLASYPLWNPFVVACASTLAPGSPISMRVRVFPFWTQPQREQIFEHMPGRRLRYGIRPLPFGALASSRFHEVTAIAPDRTKYSSHFELTGWLVPVVSVLLGGRLTRGFAAMSKALKIRAEALRSERGS